MNLITISGVKGYIDESGTAWLHLETVARGLGFTTVATSGNECVRWARVEQYLTELGFNTDNGYLPDSTFIPENIFYLLAMKASNQTAVAFQMKVANEILPSIRKTGSYSVQPKLPTTYLEALEVLVASEKEKLILLPKAESFDTFMDAKNNQDMNTVAKTLGVGRNKLFEFLRTKKVCMANNTPYQEHIDCGRFVVKERPITMGDNTFNKPQTFVTPKGVTFIEKLLKSEKVSA